MPLEAVLALVGFLIDQEPAILADIEALTSSKRQQYPSVAASVVAETASGVAALKASE